MGHSAELIERCAALLEFHTDPRTRVVHLLTTTVNLTLLLALLSGVPVYGVVGVGHLVALGVFAYFAQCHAKAAVIVAAQVLAVWFFVSSSAWYSLLLAFLGFGAIEFYCHSWFADPANKIDLASGSGIQRVLYVVFCSALFFQVLVALDLGFADADLARRIVVRIPQRK